MTGQKSLETVQFPCRSDNFGLLVHDRTTGQTISIDTPEETPIVAALAQRGWQLTHILNTHHHFDHVGSNLALKGRFGCEIVGARHDADRIPGLDTGVSGGDVFMFGSHEIHVLETPGHTTGHVSYWFPDSAVLFTGDTLFSMGCGRLFEGNGTMMWDSLQKIKALPPETMVYCAHEYTMDNGEFALGIEPGNRALQDRMVEVRALRRGGKATLPVPLQLELDTNPFLRPDSPEIQASLGMEGRDLAEVFTRTRMLKDRFR